MRHIYDKCKVFSRYDDTFTKEKIKLLRQYLPHFYQNVWDKYYVPNTARSHPLLWEQELNNISHDIVDKVEKTALAYEDILKSSTIKTDKDANDYSLLFDDIDRKNKKLMKCIEFSQMENNKMLLQHFNDSWYRLMIKMKTEIDLNIMREILLNQDPS
eukprot:310408_1